MSQELHHQDDDIDCFQLQSPLQEYQPVTISRQDTIVKIPEPGNEAEAPHGPQRLRRTTLEG